MGYFIPIQVVPTENLYNMEVRPVRTWSQGPLHLRWTSAEIYVDIPEQVETEMLMFNKCVACPLLDHVTKRRFLTEDAFDDTLTLISTFRWVWRETVKRDKWPFSVIWLQRPRRPDGWVWLHDAENVMTIEVGCDDVQQVGTRNGLWCADARIQGLETFYVMGSDVHFI